MTSVTSQVPDAATRPGLPEWLVEEISTVPAMSSFPDVDAMHARTRALAAEHTGVLELSRIGTSARGEPLLCLTVRGGPQHAVIIGLPHPNEPIGGSTALHLARRLAEDAALRERLGLTWHLVLCIDPDGLRLNEGWLAGPFTREHYARNFFRQAGPEQIEWTFPVDHKEMYFDAVLPETMALMRLIDVHRPVLMASLHNAETGGAYYYLSRSEPELHPVLQRIPAHLGVPLHRGEAEADWIEVLDDGIYRSLDIRDAYDALEARGEHRGLIGGGNSTGGHTAPYGTMVVVVELPCWLDPRADDLSEASVARSAALSRQAADLLDLGELIGGELAGVADRVWVDSPILRSARFHATMVEQMGRAAQRRADAVEGTAADRMTTAELGSVQDAVHMLRLRVGGMALRALDGELAVGNIAPALRAARERVAARFAQWCTEAAALSPAQPLPIGDLVAAQYGAVLATAAHLAGSLQAGPWTDPETETT